MTHEIWLDLKTRMENLRADMVQQWTGEMNNVNIEHGVGALGTAIQMWLLAEPVVPPPHQEPPA